jgi:molybdopterin molybdotransferase
LEQDFGVTDYGGPEAQGSKVGVLTVREALTRCLTTAPSVRTERVSLSLALGRVLAEDVVSQTSLPPWDNSAMDGFAVRTADTMGGRDGTQEVDACFTDGEPGKQGPWLEVIEVIAAGSVPTRPLSSGQAARIMTGAPVPAGCDAVVMQEHTTSMDGRVQIQQEARAGQHIRREGENLRAGALAVSKGTVLNPGHLGLCASVGQSTLEVARQPRVGIVSTGDELIRAGQALGPGQIYASNSATLAALVTMAGGIPVDCGIAPDNLEATRKAFQRAAECDLILSTGGVSVGDFDLVLDAMESLGATMEFWKVRMKPGKPLALGIIGGTPAFGLPGNPVSSHVGFLQFVRPWLRTALGDPNPFLPVVKARLEFPFRKRAGRVELVRVHVVLTDSGWLAKDTGSQSSGSPSSMASSNGLLLAEEGALDLPVGTTVCVQLIQGNMMGIAHPGYPWQ